MMRSFVGLTVKSVVAAWALGFVALVVFAQAQTWTEDDARRDGVFLLYDLLDRESATSRVERLRALRPHFALSFHMAPRAEVERRLGRAVGPGDAIVLEETLRRTWFFAVFHDGSGALVAGPLHPAVPRGARPIGLLLAVVGIPLIAGLMALRIGRELTKVERANLALATGELSARVDNPHGPSSELATSFNAMAERVERLIRRRDELVQAVSHELGSPLSRLRFHMELLGSAPEGQRDDRLAAMRRELESLEGLVSELLEYVQSDGRELEVRAFAPQAGLRDLAELSSLEAADGCDIEVALELPPGVSVIADQRLFLRAIENLLRNAFQHARQRVRLELHDGEAEVRVEVHDDGPGIPEALRDKVLLPFFRRDIDRPRKNGGAGLGLAIVHRILEQHGGRLTIGDSPSLGGAQVCAVWPRKI